MIQQPPATDPFARALLPVLVHEMNNVTQKLALAQALLEPSNTSSAARVDLTQLFADEARRIDDLGWAMAALSSAVGADLVLARRNDRDAQVLLGLARLVVRREGRDFDLTPSASLRCAPNVGNGWELSWTLASWLWAVASSAQPGTALVWSVQHAQDRVLVSVQSERDASAAPLLDDATQRIRRWLPEIHARVQGAQVSLDVPARYLRTSQPAHEARLS